MVPLSRCSWRRRAGPPGPDRLMKSLWDQARSGLTPAVLSHGGLDRRSRDVQEQYLTTSLILRPRCLLGNKAAPTGSGSGPVPPLEGGYDGWNAATVPHHVNAAGSTPRPVSSPAPAFITHSNSSNSNLFRSDEAQKVPITTRNSSAVRLFPSASADVTRTLKRQR